MSQSSTFHGFFFTRFIRGAKRFQKPRVNPYILAVINNGAF